MRTWIAISMMVGAALIAPSSPAAQDQVTYKVLATSWAGANSSW